MSDLLRWLQEATRRDIEQEEDRKALAWLPVETPPEEESCMDCPEHSLVFAEPEPNLFFAVARCRQADRRLPLAPEKDMVYREDLPIPEWCPKKI